MKTNALSNSPSPAAAGDPRLCTVQLLRKSPKRPLLTPQSVFGSAESKKKQKAIEDKEDQDLIDEYKRNQTKNINFTMISETRLRIFEEKSLVGTLRGGMKVVFGADQKVHISYPDMSYSGSYPKKNTPEQLFGKYAKFVNTDMGFMKALTVTELIFDKGDLQSCTVDKQGI